MDTFFSHWSSPWPRHGTLLISCHKLIYISSNLNKEFNREEWNRTENGFEIQNQMFYLIRNPVDFLNIKADNWGHFQQMAVYKGDFETQESDLVPIYKPFTVESFNWFESVNLKWSVKIIDTINKMLSSSSSVSFWKLKNSLMIDLSTSCGGGLSKP